MSNYRRAFIPGGCFFFTVNLLERRQALLVDEIAGLRQAVTATRRAYPFTIDAFVVLPDHLRVARLRGWRITPIGPRWGADPIGYNPPYSLLHVARDARSVMAKPARSNWTMVAAG